MIFLAGILISLLAFHFYHQQDLNRARTEFDRLADHYLSLITDNLEQTLQQLESIKQLYYASNQVSSEDFHIFARYSLNLSPNLLFVGWIANPPPLLPSNNAMIGLSFINLNEKKESPHQFLPFTYLEFASPSETLDMDNAAYSTMHSLLRQSQYTPTVTISDKISYFQKGKKEGFFLFNPVFVEDVQKQPLNDYLRGTIVGLSSFEAIFQERKLYQIPLDIDVSLYDVTIRQQLLYRSLADRSSPAPLQERWARDETFNFGNRRWQLHAVPTVTFLSEHSQWSHWEIPLIGILVSALMASYFLSLINRHLKIEQEVKKRTEELDHTNRILQQEIAERQRIEDDFIKKQRDLQKKHEALEYLTKFAFSELKQAINEVLLRTALVMQIDRVSIWFHEAEHQPPFLTCVGLYSPSNHAPISHLEIVSTYFPHYFQALKTQSYLTIPSTQDAQINQEFSSYLAAFHIISKLDIPIIFEDRLLGVLCCEETRTHREWLLEDRHFGQTIADIIALIMEQTARRRAEKALQENEERLRFITQTAIDAIISVTDQGEIISWNYGAEQMFGYQEVEILGKRLEVIIQLPPLQESIRKPIEVPAQHKDGHIFPTEISHTRWKSGELFYDTFILREITERKENERRLIKAMREAKAASQTKSEFLATISHELRTPLNSIIGFNQCLLMGIDGPITQQQEESLKKIEKSSFHLLTLINDVLDLARIEAKKMELEISACNIVEVATSCIDELNPPAQKKNLPIHFTTTQPFILIEIDKMRIRQVLLNLLSNAIKFTEEGFIKVMLINHLDQVEIRVKDTGIGLSPEEMIKIFQPFSQADSSITRKYGGSGLGLVISKNIIDFHGGIISVESEKNEGTTFTIILPKVQN